VTNVPHLLCTTSHLIRFCIPMAIRPVKNKWWILAANNHTQANIRMATEWIHVRVQAWSCTLMALGTWEQAR